jgi:hypothetical protein
MSRFRTTKLRGGAVVQSGLDIRNRDQPYSRAKPQLGLYRAFVYRTYTPYDAEGERRQDNRRGYQVECDVLLVRTQQLLLNVPVQQTTFGVNNAQPWIPRPTTRTLSGQNEVRFQVQGENGRFEGVATPFDDIDGEMVIVQFVEGDPDFPIITGALVHQQTKRKVLQSPDGRDGWAEDEQEQGFAYEEEHYLHHQGTEVRINGGGDILIDTTGAYEDAATEDTAAARGNVRMRVKEGQRLTIAMGADEDVLEVFKDGDQLRVDLGEAADERVILGDSWRSFFNDWLSNEYYMHTHPTGVGPSSAPIEQLGTEMSEDLLSDLSKTKKT